MKSIDAREIRSDLIMKDIYFSQIEFNQKKDLNKTGQISLQITYSFNIVNIAEDEKEIVVGVQIKDAEGRISVIMTANGIFEASKELPAEIDKEMLFRNNAVAIMFPFIRSQVALITAQPGLTPIMLQPINISKIWAEQK